MWASALYPPAAKVAGEPGAFFALSTPADLCQTTNKVGEPCSARAWRDGLCIWHHPARAEEVAAARKRGGQARSNKARALKSLPTELMTNEQLHSYLSVVFKAVIAGRIEPGVGTASSTIARTMLELFRAIDLEARIAALERRIADAGS